MKTDYNGWTNKQTWNINLTYSEIFSNMCEEQEFNDLDHLVEAFENIVTELEFDIAIVTSLDLPTCNSAAGLFNPIPSLSFVESQNKLFSPVIVVVPVK